MANQNNHKMVWSWPLIGVMTLSFSKSKTTPLFAVRLRVAQRLHDSPVGQNHPLLAVLLR
ncbi:hypothetical protein KOSB73_350103 [Klebsiella grimontii]|uniref:Uncharacterized protein n=1 Tax=Klebsiella grimontii TaxID=2058152 RepID=A0A285B990_9ENTR|nr:hypothetical protein KOSB73_350103 [Klebsiella grimontii]